MKFKEEFKQFAFKGNVVDMAVGVIIGGAFGKIVTGFVNDIIMPALSLLTGGVNFTDLKWVIKEAVMDGDKVVTAESAILYGSFIQTVIDFFLIALSIFFFVKIISAGREKLKPAVKEEDKKEDGKKE